MLKTRAVEVTGTSLIQDADGAFTVAQFCERYALGRTAFYEEVKAGRLIVKKRGTRTLVPRGNARAWFDALPTMSSPANDTGKPTASVAAEVRHDR